MRLLMQHRLTGVGQMPPMCAAGGGGGETIPSIVELSRITELERGDPPR
jgi:hypothetical protein